MDLSRLRIFAATAAAIVVAAGCGTTDASIGSEAVPTTGSTQPTEEARSSDAARPGDDSDPGEAAEPSDPTDPGEAPDTASPPAATEGTPVSAPEQPTLQPQDGWATPSAVMEAMITRVTIKQAQGVKIESVTSGLWSSEWGRESLNLSVAATSKLPVAELACLLEREPLLSADESWGRHGDPCEETTTKFRHGPANIAKPPHAKFKKWQNPITTFVETPEGVAATAWTHILRENKGEGSGYHPTALAVPLEELLSATGHGFDAWGFASSLTWRPAEPNLISAELSIRNMPADDDAMIAWIRERSVPGTFATPAVDKGDTGTDSDNRSVSAILGGEPAVSITWQADPYRSAAVATFVYELDADGTPIPNPRIAAGPIKTDLIDWGSSWHFDADGVVDPNWNRPEFDQAGWAAGEAPLVRKETGATLVPTPDGGLTSWFRREFTVADASALKWLEIETLADDGLVVWLNGVELYRANMPSGPIEPSTFAVERISGDDELVPWRQGGLPLDGLIDGPNVLAVEIHQATSDSSDIRFDLRLVAS